MHAETPLDTRTPWGLVTLLGALTAFAAISIDMYLPSLPSIARSFGARPAAAQTTLAAFFAGLAIGQFFHGPASDRWGRRAPDRRRRTLHRRLDRLRVLDQSCHAVGRPLRPGARRLRRTGDRPRRGARPLRPPGGRADPLATDADHGGGADRRAPARRLAAYGRRLAGDLCVPRRLRRERGRGSAVHAEGEPTERGGRAGER